jgi:hypothetical protein
MILAGTALFSGCGGTTTSAQVGVMYGYGVTYVDAVPAYVYGYTPVYYHSYPAYWVDGRWYYRSPSGWLVFRQEPLELRHYRVREFRGMYSAPPLERYRYPLEPMRGPIEQRYRVPAPSPAPHRAPPPRPPAQGPTQHRYRVPR